MKKVNINALDEDAWSSPKGKFSTADRQVSEALGRDPKSMDLGKRHPFDVEISRIPAGKTNYPYHSHSAQWEFYYVLSGSGIVRDEEGTTSVDTGDAFLFPPDQPHQITAAESEDLVLMVTADNPIGESCHYPDSDKWMVRSPESKLIRSDGLDYFDGEE